MGNHLFHSVIIYLPPLLNHPIVEQSFAIIDREVGEHNFSNQEYQIVRRVIHATADFEYLELLKFSDMAIASGMAAIQNQVPIITDVTMVKQGINTMLKKTGNNPAIAAIDYAAVAAPEKTRTETGILKCCAQYPQGIYAIGNAPTALLALSEQIKNSLIAPSLVIGAPVGFVSVIESKQALAQLNVPQIVVQGRKGGSPVAAAIINALLILAHQDN